MCDEECQLEDPHPGQCVNDNDDVIERCVRCGWMRRGEERETYCDFPDVSHVYPVKP